MIEISNLTKQYKDVLAVDNLSLKVKEGELLGLLGVNGAGKSTTIKMLTGLIKPTSGEAKINGLSLGDNMMKIKEITSCSPQESAIARNLTVKENIEFIADIYHLSKDERNNRVESIIKDMDLAKVKDKKAKTLSGGYQRRLSIAMALVNKPSVLYLDEPTLGLDVINRRELWDIIESLKGKITIFLTTHYMEEAEALCDRIAIMKDGKMIELGTLEELKTKTQLSTLEDIFVSLCKKGDASNE